MRFENDKKIAYLTKPVLLLVLVTIIFVVGLILFVSKITALNDKLTLEKDTNSKLMTKVAVLKEVPQNLTTDTSYADLALPDKGSVLFGLNLIKSKANELGLQISNLKVSNANTATAGVFKSLISFEVNGSDDILNQFVTVFENTLPLSTLEKMSLTSSDNGTLLSMTVSFFSSEKITKIPALTGQVNSLEPSEIEFLNSLSGYNMPEFVVPAASDPYERSDPFN